jgi:hypothetical protein
MAAYEVHVNLLIEALSLLSRAGETVQQERRARRLGSCKSSSLRGSSTQNLERTGHSHTGGKSRSRLNPTTLCQLADNELNHDIVRDQSSLADDSLRLYSQWSTRTNVLSKNVAGGDRGQLELVEQTTGLSSLS